MRLNIQSDRDGEYFELQHVPRFLPQLQVLDVQASERHLLLMARIDDMKDKFLCGHDERHWFVAGVPQEAPVGTVRQAMESLKPLDVRRVERLVGLAGDARFRRKNAAFRRQGEWFFLPSPGLQVERATIRKNEPLSRGAGSKPHWVDECHRSGGEVVYVCRKFPNGVSSERYKQLLSSRDGASRWDWRAMTRNALVFVRGRVRHPDHATITLHDWHRVVMNTEGQSRAMRHVTFLD